MKKVDIDLIIYYKDIKVNSKTIVSGADKALYKKEHRWFVAPSLFSNKICVTDEESNIEAQWSYYNQSVPENRMEKEDINYDYDLGGI